MSKRTLKSLQLPVPDVKNRGPRQQVAAIASRWESIKNLQRPKNAANEFLIYGEIGDWVEWGETSPQQVSDFLAANDGNDVTIRINSPGGDVFAGIAIYNLLAIHGGEVTVIIDGIAASSATILTMAADKIIMAGNATMMIHRAWTVSAGDAAAFLKEAEILEGIDGNLVKTYAARTGRPEDEIRSLVDAETWMSAEEALAGKFVDQVAPLKSSTDPEPEPEPDAAAKAELAKRFAAAQSRFNQRTSAA